MIYCVIPEVVALYLEAEHGKWIHSEKFFDKKDKDGNSAFQNVFACGKSTMLSGDLKWVQSLLTSDKVPQVSKEDLEAYEKKQEKKKFQLKWE